MTRVFLIPLLIVLASIGGAMGLLATAPELEPQAHDVMRPQVRVVTVQPEAVRLIVHSQGTVEPRIESELVPEVAGRVEWVSPAMVSGGVFDRMQVLLRIEKADYQNELTQAKAQLMQAEAEEANARFEYERRLALRDQNLVSRSDAEAAERRLKVAEAALESAKSGLERSQRDLRRTEVRAPYRGVVRSEKVDVGQFVNRGEAVATLYATDSVEIRLPIADDQLAYLNLPLGVRGELKAESAPDVELSARFAGRERLWHGEVVRTEGELDPRSRMVHVVARIENAEPPLPVGLFVQAEIEGTEVDGIVTLPRSAIRDGNRVLVVGADNRMRFRAIEPMRFYRDEVLIRAGLKRGERVCVSPIQTVIDGMLVDPIPG